MKRSVTFALLAIVVYAAIVYMVNAARVGIGGAIAGLSTSAGPNGSLAIARLWSRMNLPFATWQQVPVLLPSNTKSTFMSVEPATTQYDEKTVRPLLRWIAQGHTAVWAVRSGGDPLMDRLKINLVPVKVSTAETAHLTELSPRGSVRNGEQIQHWDGLQLPVQNALHGVGLTRARAVYVTGDHGRVIGAFVTVGKGSVLLWTVPQVFENRYINKGDNFRLVWALVGNKSLLWDEYGHGVIAQSMLSAMFLHNRQASLWFMAAALCLYCWKSTRRFGAPVSHPLETPRFGTEFMDALAWHLRSSRLYGYAEQLFCETIRRRLMKRLGVAETVIQGDLGETDWLRLDAAMERQTNDGLKQAYASWRFEMDHTRNAGGRERSQLLERSQNLIRLLDGTPN